MLLPGRLAHTTLGDLLGVLHRGCATGMLELSAGHRRHRVSLKRGFVSAVAIDLHPPPARLGALLVEMGALTREQLTDVERNPLAEGGSLRFGDALVRSGVMSPATRDVALQRQARIRLDALFSLLVREDATIRFHVGIAARDTRIGHISAPLSPREFLYGRPRARGNRSGKGNCPRGSGEAHVSDPAQDEVVQARRLLGVGADADSETIRRAFRVAAAQVHPDRHGASVPEPRANCQVDFRRLSAAYHLLMQ